MDQLLIRSSPHLLDEDSISKIMWHVVLALTPAVAASIYFFGPGSLFVYLNCIATAQAAELVCLKLRGKPLHHAGDGSAFVTGLLVAMILPPGSAYFVGTVASAFAVAVAKHCFGGLGHNIWNPALTGRVFVQFAYPTEVSLSEWTAPRTVADAATQASPLVEEVDSYVELFLGTGVSGSLGETCKLALLLGGLYLIIRRIIDWRVPVFFIGTVYILTGVLPSGAELEVSALYHTLSGGLFLGAFFMATDMVTSPVTTRGRIVFSVGCGLLVSVIRLYGGYPEGVAYSILLMNTAVPLIDRYCKPRVYGSKTPKPE